MNNPAIHRPRPAVPVLVLPDLPTVVGMPGRMIEREVGGHICLLSSLPFAAVRR